MDWTGGGMDWVRILAYVAGTVDQELLARNEYLAAENRILKAQLNGRLTLSDADRATLAWLCDLRFRENGPGVHRSCESQPKKNHNGNCGQRFAAASCRRTVQNDGGR